MQIKTWLVCPGILLRTIQIGFYPFAVFCFVFWFIDFTNPYLEQTTHDNALPSDKYGGQLANAPSPEHETVTAYRICPLHEPNGLDVTDSGLASTHTFMTFCHSYYRHTYHQFGAQQKT